jgi:hypothetical protein
VNELSNAALLRTVIEHTNRLLVLEFKGALTYANEGTALWLQHPTVALDILDMPIPDFAVKDYHDSILFAYTMSKKPYTESCECYSAL